MKSASFAQAKVVNFRFFINYVLLPEGVLHLHYFGNGKRVFTARPEAQRCQVTPYVVNVVLVVVVLGGDR